MKLNSYHQENLNEIIKQLDPDMQKKIKQIVHDAFSDGVEQTIEHLKDIVLENLVLLHIENEGTLSYVD